MEYIDLEAWPRRPVFDFFSAVSNPFYMVTFRQDVYKRQEQGGAQEICPATITAAQQAEMGEMALKLHRVLGLAVYSRADFILDADGTPWCLETNTLPGMTPASLLPKSAAAVGLSYPALCERIAELSLRARH